MMELKLQICLFSHLLASVGASSYGAESSGYGAQPQFPQPGPEPYPERPPAPLSSYGANPLPVATRPGQQPGAEPPIPMVLGIGQQLQSFGNVAQGAGFSGEGPYNSGFSGRSAGGEQRLNVDGAQVLLLNPMKAPLNPTLTGWGTSGRPQRQNLREDQRGAPLSFALEPRYNRKQQLPENGGDVLLLILEPLEEQGFLKQPANQLKVRPQAELKLSEPPRVSSLFRGSSLLSSLLQPVDQQWAQPSTAGRDKQCNFDPTCWAFTPEAAIQGAIMYQRLTGVTCEECILACYAGIRKDNGPYVCRSVTYDYNWRICDLFAITGGQDPYYLRQFPGRAYFRPIGKCAENLPPIPHPERPVASLIRTPFKLAQPRPVSSLRSPVDSSVMIKVSENHPSSKAKIAGAQSAEEVSGDPVEELVPSPENNNEDMSMEATSTAKPPDSTPVRTEMNKIPETETEESESKKTDEQESSNSNAEKSVEMKNAEVEAKSSELESVDDLIDKLLSVENEESKEPEIDEPESLEAAIDALIAETTSEGLKIVKPVQTAIESLISAAPISSNANIDTLIDSVILGESMSAESAAKKALEVAAESGDTAAVEKKLSASDMEDYILDLTDYHNEEPMIVVDKVKSVNGIFKFGECISVKDLRGRKRCPHGIKTFIDGSRQHCNNPIDC